MKIETQLRAAAAFYFALAATATFVGCTRQPPPTVALAPSPAPTVKPQPTATAIVIQSNEAPPPALPGPIDSQPLRLAPPVQPRRAQPAAPPTLRAPAESDAQVMAQLKPAAIGNVIGDKLLAATSPDEIREQLRYLARLKLFYTLQSNNPTMMSRERAQNNLFIIRALAREGNLKLRIASGLVPIESQGVLSMNAENGIITAQQFARASQ